MRPSTLPHLVAILGIGAVAACVDAPSTPMTDDLAEAVQAGQLKLTVDTTPVLTDVDGARALVIEATTNRDLERVFSYVPDDAFGEARLTGARRFEVILRTGHELNSILSGLPIFVSIRTTSGTVRDYNARIDLGARLSHFAGSSRVVLDKDVRPTFATTDDVNPLRYRGRVTTTRDLKSLTVSTGDGAGPTVIAAGARERILHWTYDAFASAFDAADPTLTVQATFTDGSTSTKRADLDLRVTATALTTEDPYQVWPAPECTDERLACLLALPDGVVDLSACGGYRETQVCAYGHLCEIVGPRPFELTPIDEGGLEHASAQFADGCASGGGVWCHLGAVEAYAVPRCADGTIDDAVAAVLATTQDPPLQGTVVADDALDQSIFFGTLYSPGGPGFLSGIDGWVGSSQAQGWIGVDEVPCHNCSDFVDRTVLYYPDAGRVIVVTGGHGYDS